MHDDTGSVRRSLIDDLQAGVPPALALLAGLQLDLFTALADGPATATEVAARLEIDADRLSRLMRALVAAGLLQVEGSRFANGAEAGARLVRGRPGFIGDVHDLLADIWGARRLGTGQRPAPPEECGQIVPADISRAMWSA